MLRCSITNAVSLSSMARHYIHHFLALRIGVR